jgi:two-component system, NarL family, sensor histidine kinase UhpB
MGLAALEAALASHDGARVNTLLRTLRDMSDQAITELRNIMANLRPAQLDDLGLAPALRWYIKQYQAANPQVNVELTIDKLPTRLPPEHETVLFRVAQEALANVQRHARATRVALRLSQDDGVVRLRVKDNGVGFDPRQPPRHQPGSGLGLPGMRERVGLVDGRLEVDSAPGEGTCITVELSEK